MARLGFIGVGMMGHGMAGNFLKAGHELVVAAHRNRARVDDLLGRGAVEAASIRELAAQVDGVFMCVTASPQVEAVVAEITPALKAGQIVVDTSTSKPDVTVKLAGQLAEIGAGFLDAPVTGGPSHAEKGELGALVGGDSEVFARAKPWIESYSRSVAYMGSPGSGNRAKLLNNMITTIAAVTITQAYRTARNEGLDWQKLDAAMMGGGARSTMLEGMIGPALEGNFDGYQFALGNAAKDADYIRSYLETIGAPTSMISEAHAFLSGEIEQHGGDILFSRLLAGEADQQD